jgi:hypothetical protein
LASRRISMMLLRRANSGARGKEATNRVTIPNWMTAGMQALEHRDTRDWTRVRVTRDWTRVRQSHQGLDQG